MCTKSQTSSRRKDDRHGSGKLTLNKCGINIIFFGHKLGWSFFSSGYFVVKFLYDEQCNHYKSVFCLQ